MEEEWFHRLSAQKNSVEEKRKASNATNSKFARERKDGGLRAFGGTICFVVWGNDVQ